MQDGFRIDLTPPQITGESFLPGGPLLPLAQRPAAEHHPGLGTDEPFALRRGPGQSIRRPLWNSQPGRLRRPQSGHGRKYQQLLAGQPQSERPRTSRSISRRRPSLPTTTVLDPTGTYVVAYNGRIDVTFATGLPAGEYEFIAHTTELQYPGLTDAAGNPLNDITVPGEGTKDFVINFDVQPTPVYITGMAYESTYSSNGSTVVGGPQSYYELTPAGGTNTRDNVPAPPTAVVLDFSTLLPYSNSLGQPINYTQDVQLIASANGPGSLCPTAISAISVEGGLGSTGTGFTVL